MFPAILYLAYVSYGSYTKFILYQSLYGMRLRELIFVRERVYYFKYENKNFKILYFYKYFDDKKDRKDLNKDACLLLKYLFYIYNN